jgi:uncharacterized UPF0146 family protein
MVVSVMLPASLIARAGQARKVAEIGAGARFETALALAAAGPEVWVTDVDARVLAAPAPLHPLVHDATRDPPDALRGADLVVAVRPPEELQTPIARFARALGADLVLRPLKDEWADITGPFPRHVVWPDGWRFFPSNAGRER